MVAQRLPRSPQRYNLGMSRGIVVAHHAILRPHQHRVLVNEHGAHGDFARLTGGNRLVERKLKIFEIVHP
jgi:hypothetical protein